MEDKNIMTKLNERKVWRTLSDEECKRVEEQMADVSRMTNSIFQMVFCYDESDNEIRQRLTPTAPPFRTNGMSSRDLQTAISQALQLMNMSQERLSAFLGVLETDSHP
jgi:hypothetical protein